MTTSQPTPAYPPGWLNSEQYHPEQHLSKARQSSEKEDYLKVAERLVWFIREQRQMIAAGLATCSFIIRTEPVEINHQTGYAIFKTFIRDVLGNEATEIGSETRVDFSDFTEKAATKSKGRALLALGYGTAFAPELDEGEQIVDTPREARATAASRPIQERSAVQPSRRPAPAHEERQAEGAEEGEAPASEQQLLSIRKMCAALGREEPAPGTLTFSGAGALIRQLSKEYSARRRAE